MFLEEAEKYAVNNTPDYDGAVENLLNFLVQKKYIDTMSFMRNYNLNRGDFEKCLELAKIKITENNTI